MVDLSIQDLAEIVGGHLSLGTMPPLGGRWEPIGRIVVDSHQIGPGDVFWSVGNRHREDFLQAEEAFSLEALGAVVPGRHVEPWAGKFSLRVQDSEQALCRLAQWVRRQCSGLVVAVTGGEARSTAAAMIQRLVGMSGPAAPPSAVDSGLVKLALEMLNWEADGDCVVAEIHAAEQSQISEISHLCSPHIAVITGTHNTHCDPTNSRAAFAEIQTRLLGELPSDGLAILDGDDPLLRSRASNSAVPTLWVGHGADCDFEVTHIYHSDGKLSFVADGHSFDLPGCGPQRLQAAMMTVAVGAVLHRPSSEIADALLMETDCPRTERKH